MLELLAYGAATLTLVLIVLFVWLGELKSNSDRRMKRG